MLGAISRTTGGASADTHPPLCTPLTRGAAGGAAITTEAEGAPDCCLVRPRATG